MASRLSTCCWCACMHERITLTYPDMHHKLCLTLVERWVWRKVYHHLGAKRMDFVVGLPPSTVVPAPAT